MNFTQIILYTLFFLCMSQSIKADNELKSTLIDFSIGATSGAAAMAVYTPFHYFQNRQIQQLPIATLSNCRNWFRGLPALAFGKAPTLALQMSTYGIITRNIKNTSADLNTQQKTLAATIAGGASGLVNNFSQLVALHQENTGKSFIETVKQLQSKTFTRGLGSTICREMLFTNIYLNILKNLETKLNQKIDNEKLSQISSGLLSGAAIAAATQPFMVITAKLYADMHKEKYKNGFDAACQTYKQEGVGGFYKGTGYRSLGIILALPVIGYVEKTLREFIHAH